MHEAVHSAHRTRADHWWFRARRRIFAALLDRCAKLPNKARILDVGPGSGVNLPLLTARGDVTVLDRDPSSAAACRSQGTSAVLGDAQYLPCGNDSFDLACALDVLEHLDEDRAALRELWRVLAPGGTLLLSVPAWQILWGRQDVLSHHKRRYRRAALETLLVEAGFEIERLTYFNFLLAPPILALRFLGRPFLKSSVRRGKSDFDVPAPLGLDVLLERAFAWEARWVPRRNLPFGVSLLVLARKPGLE